MQQTVGSDFADLCVRSNLVVQSFVGNFMLVGETDNGKINRSWRLVGAAAIMLNLAFMECMAGLGHTKAGT